MALVQIDPTSSAGDWTAVGGGSVSEGTRQGDASPNPSGGYLESDGLDCEEEREHSFGFESAGLAEDVAELDVVMYVDNDTASDAAKLVVEISVDGGSAWSAAQTVGAGGPGWQRFTFGGPFTPAEVDAVQARVRHECLEDCSSSSSEDPAAESSSSSEDDCVCVCCWPVIRVTTSGVTGAGGDECNIGVFTPPDGTYTYELNETACSYELVSGPAGNQYTLQYDVDHWEFFTGSHPSTCGAFANWDSDCPCGSPTSRDDTYGGTVTAECSLT